MPKSSAGSVLPHAPTFQGNLTTDYTFPVWDDWKANVSAIASYTTTYYFNPVAGGPLQFDKQNSYWLVNLHGYVTPPDEKLRLGFYINNATNTKYANYRATSGPYGGYDQVALPITFGIRLEYNFGED